MWGVLGFVLIIKCNIEPNFMYVHVYTYIYYNFYREANRLSQLESVAKASEKGKWSKGNKAKVSVTCIIRA